ncbi:hypothetical protein ILUMI_24345 [Ignelater luminosus]|uniref:Uncharacterized protein n=1 Tax=Ignelater luminosus TaxID=2038154 RepID=A0A8K0C778_IGNLU|nr:hypothetical protein ILUMI_24345 [Ignelater luminosus]
MMGFPNCAANIVYGALTMQKVQRFPVARYTIADSESRYFADSRSEDSQDEDSRPYLSVQNIILPKDIKAFNTGSSIKRWANKRPRLRSAKSQIRKEEDSVETDLDSLDVSNLIKELQSECEEDEINEFEEKQPEGLDPDIKKLLEEIDKKGNAVVSGGATVDNVISNYSMEFAMESNRTDAMLSEPSRFPVESAPATIAEPKNNNGSFMFQVFCTEKQEEKKDFILESKKAVLFSRGAEK